MNIFLIIILKYTYHKLKKNSLSCIQNKNLFFDEEYYKIVSKKYLIKSTFCFIIILDRSIKLIKIQNIFWINWMFMMNLWDGIYG